MERSVSSFVNNISEGIDKIKCNTDTVKKKKNVKLEELNINFATVS